MDLATVIGLVMGFGLTAWSILLGGSIMLFVDIPSIVLVFGGTTATLFMRHKMNEVFGSIGILMKSVINKPRTPQVVISQLVDMANIARKDGILALEKVKSEDSFMQTAINHCVDGADPEFLENVLTKELDYMAARHSNGIKVWEGVAETAPAFGMIGTLIGLVQMLANMSDPAAIGPGMAVAILTTLYGAIIANLVAIPLSTKLGMYSSDEQMVRQLIIDGMIGIQKGVNPRMLQEALKAALPPSQRELG